MFKMVLVTLAVVVRLTILRHLVVALVVAVKAVAVPVKETHFAVGVVVIMVVVLLLREILLVLGAGVLVLPGLRVLVQQLRAAGVPLLVQAIPIIRVGTSVMVALVARRREVTGMSELPTN